MKAGKQRRTYTAEFKSKVAVEALDVHANLSALGARYGIHPGLVGRWRKSLIENSHRLFEDSHPEQDERDRQIEALQREVNALTADYEFLKNALSAYHKNRVK